MGARAGAVPSAGLDPRLTPGLAGRRCLASPPGVHHPGFAPAATRAALSRPGALAPCRLPLLGNPPIVVAPGTVGRPLDGGRRPGLRRLPRPCWRPRSLAYSSGLIAGMI